MYDDFGAEMEALATERMDADLLMAEMERSANELHAQIAVYEKTRNPDDCPHGTGGWGYRNPPAHPEQEGLKPGQMRCGTCRTAVPDPLADPE